jgi:hypothetical protein
MPLPLVNLDDRTFEDLVAEAIKIVPRFGREWTNHNRSDPGVTLIELFAWLVEMQQYQIDQLARSGTLKYLKLLGEAPLRPAPGGGFVSFEMLDNARPNPIAYCLPDDPLPSGADRAVRLVRAGARLAGGKLTFETTEDLAVHPGRLVHVGTSSATGFVDNSQRNTGVGLSFSAFGETAEKGSKLYLGFDRAFIPGKLVSLMFYLSEDYAIPRGSHGDEGFDGPHDITPSATLAWEYFSAALGGDARDGDWRPLLLARDETVMLSQSGRVQFVAPPDAVEGPLHPFVEPLFWLRCRVVEPGYELPPRLLGIVPNTVPVRQADTLSEIIYFSSTGERVQKFTASSFLALAGLVEVQAREEGAPSASGAWQIWHDAEDPDAPPGNRQYTLERDGLTGIATLTFGRTSRRVPAGRDNIRLICFANGFKEQRLLGTGSGLPHQSFPLERMPVVPETLVLQVGRPRAQDSAGSGPQPSTEYVDWTRVDDFDSSGPADTHYVLDAAAGEIRFGDGVRGAIPPAAPAGRNVRLLAYQVSQGAAGNVKAGAIDRVEQPFWRSNTLALRNDTPLTGGRDEETQADAQTRIRQTLQDPWRAVTDGDYVALVLSTPGLRVRRAHVVPLPDPDATAAAGPDHEVLPEYQAQVNVIVVPESTLPQPKPSAGFLATVRRHLNRHRLLTARVELLPPRYITVTVRARVTPKAGAVGGDALARKVQDALNAFLDPLNGGPDKEGWPWGRPVYRSDIYQQIEAVEGVVCVEQLSLSASEPGTQLSLADSNGNVAIPEHSLVAPGRHRIDVNAVALGCTGKGGAA